MSAFQMVAKGVNPTATQTLPEWRRFGAPESWGTTQVVNLA